VHTIQLNQSTMSTRVVKILPVLKKVKRLSTTKQRKFIASCNREFLSCICNCAKHLIKGRAKMKPVHLKKLARHKKSFRKLVLKKTSLKAKRKILQTGGFLGLLLPPVLGFLSSLISR